MSDLRLRYPREEILEALPHYLLARCGHAPQDLPPAAEHALEMGVRLAPLIEALDPAPGRSGMRAPPDEALVRSLGSEPEKDFSFALIPIPQH